ncbi:hypothetical protein LTR94_023853 [Friedmanniomyces endolithicus]|nr:hypothetical protein LTR94_023853 [Friedmanniomyces endolithicus]
MTSVIPTPPHRRAGSYDPPFIWLDQMGVGESGRPNQLRQSSIKPRPRANTATSENVMASIAALNLNLREMTQSLTIKVTGLAGFRFRLLLARLIFRIGAAVAGTKLVIDLDATETI